MNYTKEQSIKNQINKGQSDMDNKKNWKVKVLNKPTKKQAKIMVERMQNVLEEYMEREMHNN